MPAARRKRAAAVASAKATRVLVTNVGPGGGRRPAASHEQHLTAYWKNQRPVQNKTAPKAPIAHAMDIFRESSASSNFSILSKDSDTSTETWPTSLNSRSPTSLESRSGAGSPASASSYHTAASSVSAAEVSATLVPPPSPPQHTASSSHPGPPPVARPAPPERPPPSAANTASQPTAARPKRQPAKRPPPRPPSTRNVPPKRYAIPPRRYVPRKALPEPTIQVVGSMERLLCPLTKKVLVDAVRSRCGHVYSRFAIEAHMKVSTACPVCSGRLTKRSLIADPEAENRSRRLEAAWNAKLAGKLRTAGVVDLTALSDGEDVIEIESESEVEVIDSRSDSGVIDATDI